MEKNDSQLLSKPQAEKELDWKSCHPWREKQNDGSMARTVTRRANTAGLSTLARRLMAMERARALGRKPANAQALALELEVRRWLGEGAVSEQATRMGKV